MIRKNKPKADVNILEDKATIGGGSMPGQFIDTYCIEIKPHNISINDMESKFRRLDTPIVARIANDALILDVLTVDESDFLYIAQSINEVTYE